MMTDLEKIELAARRVADKFAMSSAYNASAWMLHQFADELAVLNHEVREIEADLDACVATSTYDDQ